MPTHVQQCCRILFPSPGPKQRTPRWIWQPRFGSQDYCEPKINQVRSLHQSNKPEVASGPRISAKLHLLGPWPPSLSLPQPRKGCSDSGGPWPGLSRQDRGVQASEILPAVTQQGRQTPQGSQGIPLGSHGGSVWVMDRGKGRSVLFHCIVLGNFCD